MGLQVFERNTQALEQARQEDVTREQNANGPFILNPRAGRTAFRVMPPWDESGMWYFEVKEHNFLNGKPTPFLCIEESQGRCPICEHGAAVAASGDEETAKKFRPATKFFINTLVFSDSTGKNTINNGIMVMRVGVMVKKALLDYDLDVSGGYGDITSYEAGFDVNLDKTGSGLLTKYTIKVNPQRNDVIARLANEGIDAATLSLHALDQILPELSYDDLSEAFSTLMGNEPAPSAQPVPVATVKPGPARPGQTPAPTQSVAPVAKFATIGGPTIGGLKIAPPPLPRKK